MQAHGRHIGGKWPTVGRTSLGTMDFRKWRTVFVSLLAWSSWEILETPVNIGVFLSSFGPRSLRTPLYCSAILTGELEAWRVIPRMAVDLSSCYPVPEVFLQGAEVSGTSLTVFATSASSGRVLL